MRRGGLGPMTSQVAAPALAAGLPAIASPGWQQPGAWRTSDQFGTSSQSLAQSGQGNGQAVASLVFGMLSIFFCWLGLIAVAMIILAVAFGAIGILRSRLGFSNGTGPAIAGLVLAGAGAGLYLAFGVLSLGLGFRV